jgi:hypothetical protein
MKHGSESPVSFLAHIARLPRNGMPVAIDADATQRARLAADHGLLAVDRYRVDLLVAPWKRDGVKVTGKVEADILQESVISLEAIENHISEEVAAIFLPEGSKLGGYGFEERGELVLDPEGPDVPETFSGDTIDVGALAEQFFALGIDPYPRKPGETLERVQDEDLDEEVGSDSPFAKLNALKGKS